MSGAGGTAGGETGDGGPGGVRGYVHQLLALERDVLVLSVAMLAFSLAFQMTSRYVPEYLVALFAFSGLRFAGLPAHKAPSSPPREGSGGTVTGAYYLARNVVVIPSAAISGYLWEQSPELAFTAATVVGLVGVGYFAIFGKESRRVD